MKFMIKGAYRALARLWLARLLVVISFVLYTAAALSLHQPSLSPFYVEEDDPLPAVLSHWIYGLPLGEVDRGLETYFHSAEAAKQPVDVTVQGAFQRGAPPSGNIGQRTASESAVSSPRTWHSRSLVRRRVRCRSFFIAAGDFRQPCF